MQPAPPHHQLHDLHGEAEAEEVLEHVPAGPVHHEVGLVPEGGHERRGRGEHVVAVQVKTRAGSTLFCMAQGHGYQCHTRALHRFSKDKL
jgi:hypothetical protein